jgi:hypothetical protein
MATVRDLIAASLRSIGALASGESATAAEAADALVLLNELLESWCLESLLVYNVTQNVFTLAANTQSYTIGTGGVFNVERPTAIEAAFLRDSTTTPAIDLPMGVLSQAQWADIAVKGLTAGYPLWVYLDLAYPLGHVLVWPVPPSAQALVLWLEQPLTSFASLDTTLALPKGYQRALRTHLAIELCPEYGRAVSPELAGQASEAKEVVKRSNSVTPLLTCDAGVRQGRGSSSASVLRAGG